MEEHNNLSNRCPELQNILDSSFGFRFKWGTLLVILFILLILALSFFVSIREQQTLYAECKACQKQEHLWISTLYVRNTKTQLKMSRRFSFKMIPSNLVGSFVRLNKLKMELTS